MKKIIFPILGILLLVILIPFPASFALNSLLHECSANTTTGNTGHFSTNCSLTINSTSTIVVVVTAGEGCSTSNCFDIFSVADSFSNSLTTVGHFNAQGGTLGQTYITGIYVLNGTGTTGSDTITVTWTQNNGLNGNPEAMFWVYDISGKYLSSGNFTSGDNSGVSGSVSLNAKKYYAVFSGGEYSNCQNGGGGSGSIGTLTLDSNSVCQNTGLGYSIKGIAGYNMTSTGGTNQIWTGGSGSNWQGSGAYVQTSTSNVGPLTTTITTTLTETGIVAPCFVSGSSSCGSYNWILAFLFLLLPPSIFSSFGATSVGRETVSRLSGDRFDNYSHVEGNTLIFTTLFGLLVGSVLGVLPTVNALPLWLPFAFGAIFVIYVWKGS